MLNKKVVEVFKEFQSEMLKKQINVKTVWEISNNVKKTCNIEIPKSSPNFFTFIRNHTKKD